MSSSEQLTSYAVKSYRYLRLSIIVVVASVLAAVVIERIDADCWQGSISAYYYTPAHSVFVGALVAIGVSLIAIKGSTDREDILLNLAGVLAPIVAFVPTSPGDQCPSSAALELADRETYINNNVLALAIGGGLAIVVTIVLLLVFSRDKLGTIDRGSAIGLGFAVVLLLIGLVWYFGFRDSFLERAHGGAAVVMFFIIWVVMILNARGAPDRRYRRAYSVTATAMALAAIVAVVGKLIDSDWRHQILWLEFLELVAFAAYWAVQTSENWTGGVPAGEEREDRSDVELLGAANRTADLEKAVS